MGKVDQGVFAYWMLAHHFGRPLSYIGFGGSGKQVRDLLHVDDLVDLVDDQLGDPERWDGNVVNVGGGRDCSPSLLELTELCREITGNRVSIAGPTHDRPGDVPIYVSDCAALFELTDWRPQRTRARYSTDIYAWIRDNERALGAGARDRIGGELMRRSRSSPAPGGSSARSPSAISSRPAST